MQKSEHGPPPPGGQKKQVFLVLLLVTFLTMLVLTADITQNSPEFCSRCHTMKPEYYTWKASSHSNFGCTECHRGEGARGAYNFARDLLRWTHAEITGSYIRPIRLFRSIDDDVCFRCHTYNRQTTASGDLIIPHEQHTDRRVRCVSCHSAIAHGDIARRSVTRKIDYADWDKDQGLQEMARELVQPSMDDCMACHYRRRVSTECGVCHENMTGPDHHRLPDFAYNHGTFAREELADCNFCHGYTGARKMQVRENTTVLVYTRQNRFCLSCHRVRPESHGGGEMFRITHGQRVKAGVKREDDCLVCHDNNVVDLPVAAQTTCAGCHPARHGSAWRDRHLPKVAEGEHISYRCLNCHAARTCLGCHYVPGISAPRPSAPVLPEDFSEYNDFQPVFQ